jgi:hypothetical protein
LCVTIDIPACDELTAGGEEGDDGVEGQVTTQETGWARAWLSASIPGISTGYESGCWTREGEDERRVEGNAREDKYVAAVRKRSLSVRVK